MKMVRAVRTGGKGARTDNAEGLLTYRIKRATTPHRTGKLEDGGCAVHDLQIWGQQMIDLLYEIKKKKEERISASFAQMEPDTGHNR